VSATSWLLPGWLQHLEQGYCLHRQTDRSHSTLYQNHLTKPLHWLLSWRYRTLLVLRNPIPRLRCLLFVANPSLYSRSRPLGLSPVLDFRHLSLWW
jgi:hypothetical protein